MTANQNGVNMFDVKKRNRSSIIEMIHHYNGISRKEIAAALGLTPAAITLITNDLLQEGLLVESALEQSTGRKGRKEVMLEINRTRYATVGIYVSKHKFDLICTDLNYRVLFEDSVYIDDCRQSSALILEKISDILDTLLTNYDVLRNHILIGIGICVHGIVNSASGISITSYGIWENHIDVASHFEEKFHVPVLLTNNICALAHGEAFLAHNNKPTDMLFVKYGPGVGAARINSKRALSVSDYKAIELSHLIMDPNGAPCVCGNQGCLESIISYDSIEQSIAALVTPASSPALFTLTNGNPKNINMNYIIQAYEAGDNMVQTVIRRTVRYLALAVKNVTCLLNPETVVLYGELFEHESFRDALKSELSRYTAPQKISFSHFNLKLNALGPATTMIAYFFENGGIIA